MDLTFTNLPLGTYQVFIHKERHPTILTSTFATSVCGLGLDEGIQGIYFEALYTASTSIATAAFTVCSPCNVLFNCSRMPVGLRSVQLKKLEHGQYLKLSPQWQMVTRIGAYPAKEQTAVGHEWNGDALWLSHRLDNQMRSQVGKIRPDLAFHYAGVTSGKEQLCGYSGPNDGSFPGVLTNARDFAWVETDLKHVDAILQNAVLLAAHQQGQTQSRKLYGARVRFCGWSDVKSRPHDSYRMMTSGQLISLLPGKFEVGDANGKRIAAAVFTWGGKTTSRFGLEENQAFELLCFKQLGAT